MKKRLLGVLMLTFLIGGGSLFTLAEDITVVSKDFPLGTNVVGKWNKDNQTLTMTGQGKIEKSKWQSLVSELGLKNQGTEEVKINFWKEVRFPDDASGFFSDFQSKHITFDSAMDTSNVTNMNNMFRGAVNFNTDISAWKTENVTKMQSMFQSAQSFNQNLENWNVQKLETAASMFNGATSFNGDINWKTLTKLTSINAMFKGAKKFNKPLNEWDTSKITDMNSTFDGASNFNQDIGMWKTQNVTKMYAMFQDAEQFNQDIGSWDTSSVTTMQAMFRRAKVFNQDLSKWETWKVTNISNLFEDAEAFQGKGVKNWKVNSVTKMVQTFSNALAFNEDISEWTLEALEDGDKFIYFWKSWTPSFSRENHDKLLEEWSKKLKQSTKEIPLTIDAPYCLGAEAISTTLKRKNYKHSTKYQRDCELKASKSENKESKESIKSTVTITSVLPADKITANISAEKTNVTYKDWKCETINADSPSIKECSFEVTSTEGGRNLEISYNDGVSTKSRTGTYLIDNQGPQLPQVTIDTQDPMEKTTITLKEFPQDIWGAGVAKCHIWYTNSENNYVNYDILDNQLPRTSSIKALDKFDHDTKGVYTLTVRCEDKLWNEGDKNIVKFPPIIDFSSENKTIIKKDETFTGSFTIYSPSGKDIDEISPDRTWNIGLSKITCKVTKDTSQSWELSQVNRKISNMAGKNDKEHKITCSYEGKGKETGTLKIEAKDTNNAQGQSSQKFTVDSNPPAIKIEPNQAISSGNIEVTITITITDNIKLNPDSVKIDGVPIDLSKCSENTTTKLVCPYSITSPAIDKTITVTAQDAAGHETSIQSKEFTIDTQAPSITNPQMAYENKGTVAKLSFTAEDAGVGLRTKTDQENNVSGFDWNAISYGFSENATCNNYQQEAILTPESAQPFKLSFELTNSEHNGKYVCVQVKDKVWNLTSVSLGQLKINQAPTLADTSATIAENFTVGSSVLTLVGNDPNGDDLTYAITAGDDNEAFAIEGNNLILKKSIAAWNYTLIMKVTDARGLSSDVQVTITVDPAPTFENFPTKEVPTKRGRSLDTITFTVKDNKAVDKVEIYGLPDGVTAKIDPENASVEKKTVTISGAPTKRGSYKVTVSAHDEIGNVITREFTIVVRGKPSQNDPSSAGVSYDNCPNGDYSGSRTDGRCDAPQSQVNTGKNQTLTTGDQTLSLTGKVEQLSDTKPELVDGKTKYQDTVIFNPTIENGKCYTRREYLGIKDSEKTVTSEEFKKALSFLRSYEMTMFDGVEGFDPYRNLSREEAAKIFSNFAMHVLCRKPDINLSVNYSDVENANPTLKPYITLAYQLGVMKGSGMGDGEFRPFDAISKAEVNAVLIRMILKSYLDEKQSENKTWYSEYNKVATDLGIINQGAGAEPVLRNNVALMLFRAYKNQVFDWRNINYFSYVLKSRDLFVK